MRARTRLAAVVAGVALAGCASTSKPAPEPLRPVRFAVIAAPEVGTDDGDLALAVTRLSREKDLAFVLVPGPLLARDADKIALELLKNDLGQLAPPVYVAFTTTTAPVGSPTTPAPAGDRPTSDEILGALEGMGPGPKRQIAYHHSPSRAPGVVVEVLGNGSRGFDALPKGTRRLVTCLATGTKLTPKKDAPSPDLLVTTGPVDLRAGKEGEPVVLRVPPLSASKSFVLATMHPIRLEVEVVALEGTAPKAPESVPLRALPED